MKKAICSVCERKYWAQTTKAEGSAIREGATIITKPSKPKTERCKKHASPMKVHPRSARHHFSKDIKRRVNRRSSMGLTPKKGRSKENGTSQR